MRRIFSFFKSGTILLCAIFFSLLPKRKMTLSHTILISQTAKLGDMVCTTPMFRAVKEKYPNATLCVMGNVMNREILEGNPYINKYLVPNSKFFGLVNQLKLLALDFACTTSPNFEFTAACIVARVPIVVVPHIVLGWSPYERLSYKILKYFVITREHRMGSYAPAEYLRLLEPLGIQTRDTRKEIFFSETARNTLEKVLNKYKVNSLKDKIIGILPGAGNEIKSWAPKKFAELMNMIANQHSVTFVLLGAGKDADRASIIKGKVNTNVKIVDLIGQLSIDELKACIRKLDMVIGADTGPQYIAEALEIPTIDIIGPVDEREQPPIGKIHRIVKVERKKAQLYVMNARVYDAVEAKRQTDAITSKMVFVEYMHLWNN